MVEVNVNVSNVEEGIVKKLLEYMGEKFRRIAEVDLKGEQLLVSGEKVSKSKVKLYLKKFLHSQGMESFKVLSGGGNTILLHKIRFQS
ncbi:MAG: hypothetical protein ACTSVF_05305 [Candidatus Asgardarchaeia archaeon]